VKTLVFENKRELGSHAAKMAADCIRSAIEARGNARINAATGASQFDFFDALTRMEGIEWQKVTLFHLDEYVFMPESHPASLRRYLKERLISKVGIGTCHLLNPEVDPASECRRVGNLIREAPIDVSFVGIGENGHLAFDDPPADFETEEPYLVVNIDIRSRQQQFGEGWFAALEDVPSQAVSISVRQILKSRTILCIVPEARKAEAVRATLREPVSPMVPASILRTHPDTNLLLDRDSASLINNSDLS
jgi:glucosamine-6-phosphate deaminase